MKPVLVAALLVASSSAADLPARFGHTPSQFKQHDVDPAFRCELDLDDFDGFRKFRFLVGLQRRCAVAAPDMPRVPCLFEAYWLDDRKPSPVAMEDMRRLRERCGFAVRAERAEWPLHTLHDVGTEPYIALHVMCHGDEPVALRVEGGHAPNRKERICPLPDALRLP